MSALKTRGIGANFIQVRNGTRMKCDSRGVEYMAFEIAGAGSKDVAGTGSI